MFFVLHIVRTVKSPYLHSVLFNDCNYCMHCEGSTIHCASLTSQLFECRSDKVHIKFNNWKGDIKYINGNVYFMMHFELGEKL